MRTDVKVEKVYLYPKSVDFRKAIDGLAALVDLDIKVAFFDTVLSVLLSKPSVSVRPSHLSNRCNKGDVLHLKIRGHHCPYRQDFHAQKNLLSQTR